MKWFSAAKGFGFLAGDDGTDYFAHVSSVQPGVALAPGDVVEFVAVAGRAGKPAAARITVVERYDPRPYYGKPTTRTTVSESNVTTGVLVGAVLGAIAGPVGVAIGAAVGAAVGLPRVSKKELTSPCLRCGGTGHVTAIADGFIGFQCPQCRSFWRKRDSQ